jgi:hypothetical protein
MVVQAGLGKIHEILFGKLLKQKGLMTLAQVTENLPSKCKALSSNSSTSTKSVGGALSIKKLK